MLVGTHFLLNKLVFNNSTLTDNIELIKSINGHIGDQLTNAVKRGVKHLKLLQNLLGMIIPCQLTKLVTNP